ncbi:MAG: S-layer homology domain-containing protein [Firmicutes bacterium]|nr:S-layer homology domain-containing protein [Bacillota bacterium]
MKRIYAIILVAVFILGFPNLGTAAAVIINPDFEMGDESGWERRPMPPGATSPDVEIVTSADGVSPQSGDYCAKITRKDVAGRLIQNVSLTKGAEYICSAWVRAQSGTSALLTAQLAFDLGAAMGSGADRYKTVTKAGIGDLWTPLELKYTATQDLQTVSIYIQITTAYGEASKVYYIDNFKLLENAPPSAASVSIAGSSTLTVAGDEITAQYNATVFDQYGESATVAQDVYWLIKEDTDKIQISEGGKVTVAADIDLPSFTIEAVSAENDEVHAEKEVLLLHPSAPVASNVVINGELFMGNKMTGNYDYFDLNEDEESGTLFQWYREKDGVKQKITGAVDTEYTLVQADVGFNIIFEVTPKNRAKLLPLGEAVSSQPVGPVRKPIIQFLTIDASKKSDYSGSVISFRVLGQPADGSEAIDLTSSATVKAVSGCSVSGVGKVMLQSGSSAVLSASFTDGENKTVSKEITFGILTRAGGGGGGGGGGGTTFFVPAVPITIPDKPETMPEIIDEASGELGDAPIEITKTFPDIDGHYAKEAIEILASIGYLDNIADTVFEPDRPIVRADAAALIMRASRLKVMSYDGIYTDIDTSSWYADYLQTAYDTGIAQGDSNQFRPNDSITREEFAKIIVTMFEGVSGRKIDRGFVAEGFDDFGSMSDWAVPYISKSINQGLFKGTTDTIFDPQSSITRAQAVLVVKRVIEAFKEA